ncbi:MAG: FISUMP domain-containing protein [Saprospiraceae bacterium]
MDIYSEIKALLAKGETEKALDLLVEKAHELSPEVEQQALLLSGQYKQWKRERTLGIEQSSGELRRIELGIIQLLDYKRTPAQRMPLLENKTATIGGGVMKYMAIGVLLLAGVGLWLYFPQKNTPTPSTTGEQASTTLKPFAAQPKMEDTVSIKNTTEVTEEPKTPPTPKLFLYKTVDLAGKTWMAENLNEHVSGSVCYNDDPYNCTQYGRLYTQAQARKACKALGDGWHLPTDADWKDLTRMYGGAYGDMGDGLALFQRLRTGGPTQFEGSYGGKRIYIGDPPAFYFYDYGKIGYYWVDAPMSDNPANGRIITFRTMDSMVLYESAPNTEYLSCRCVK